MIEIPVLAFKLILVSWITAKRQLIHDRTASRDTWNQSYDYIVVGAGAAGCVVANRLAQDPNVTVLLLEAGGAQDAIWMDIPWSIYVINQNREDLDWSYYDEPNKNLNSQFPGGRIPEYSARVLGGSSSHNTLIYNRGNRKGYDNWVKEFGAIGWSYEEVLPFFLRSENNTDMNLAQMNPGYHAIGGPIQISSVTIPPLFKMFEQFYNALGYPTIDLNGHNQTGTVIIQQTVDTRGFRVSNSVYIDPNPHPTNLHIVARSLVIRIIFNGTTAIGLQFSRNDTFYTVFTRREVILCAGVYNSPQLLMLSGIGIRSHLESFGIPIVMELPVGNNFMGHPAFDTSSTILNSSFYLNPPQLSINQLEQCYLKNTGPLGYSPLLEKYFATSSRPDKSYPNVVCAVMYDTDGLTLSYSCTLVLPRSRGTIRLQSASPYIPPRVDPNYLADPSDFQDLVEAARFIFFMYQNSTVAPYLRAPSFEDFGCPNCPGKFNYQCDEGLKCYVSKNILSTHLGGSCRMGDVIKSDVVVDPKLRVKNINRLRVCDASIFPINPNANPNAAVTMIGEKCAQIIFDCYDTTSLNSN